VVTIFKRMLLTRFDERSLSSLVGCRQAVYNVRSSPSNEVFVRCASNARRVVFTVAFPAYPQWKPQA
jgi:hypothetical protein